MDEFFPIFLLIFLIAFVAMDSEAAPPVDVWKGQVYYEETVTEEGSVKRCKVVEKPAIKVSYCEEVKE